MKVLNRNKQRGWIAALSVSLLTMGCTTPQGGAQPEFAIHFGTLAESGPNQHRLSTETNRIPRILKAQGFLYGVEVVPRENVDYELYFVAHLPSVPDRLSGLASGNSPADAVNGVKTPSQQVRGSSITPFWFDEGDPLGAYSLEVFVNGQRLSVIKYEVVSAPSASGT